ncbi:MAG: NAD-dependent epimerase/dehydratase family protein [Chloroflexi bacterium]|nr:MAG: NAD-dependent epimerase/dehydratase family protein [Chloroflexota bacterium]
MAARPEILWIAPANQEMNVLVTGGTGTLGREVVIQLRQAGHRARILSRNPRGHVDTVQGDLATGAGLQKAVGGMDAIIHAASATTDVLRGNAVDVKGTRRLLNVAREAGVKHIVFVSIVGIDRVNYTYYKTKLAAEAIVREGKVSWSILRATQFHSFMEFTLGLFSKLPGLATVPLEWQFQPVDARDVARRLVEVVSQEPGGRLPDFGGPEVRDFKSIAESWLKAHRLNKRLVNLWLPFKFSRQVADGLLLCPDQKSGTITFEQYLDLKYGAK